jgi:adenosine deaminase
MDRSAVSSLPKVVLHDHLDGGLRPATILDIADDVGYAGLPAGDEPGLADWFHQGDSGSLATYLAAFDQTVAVMQTTGALERIAYECLQDLAGDGVVYAEVRFAPSLHIAGGLRREAVIEAVLEGMRRSAGDHGIVFGVIVDALRHQTDSAEVAGLAVRYADQGVVAFDLSGPELGHPADAHLPACRLVREAGLGLTLHAGEADGPKSIWRAYGRCHAHRIGHGVRIVEDTVVEDGEIVAVGALARTIRDQQVPLEICPTSNLHTGFVDRAVDHPVGALHRAGFTVTLNTDNRLMSGTSMTDEFLLAVTEQGFGIDDLETVTRNALEAGFGDRRERARLADEVIRPAYAVSRS